MGIIAPLLRHIMIYSVGFATPGYSLRKDYLSELGAIGAPHNELMNILGIGLIGLLMISFSIGLFKCLRLKKGGPTTTILIGSSGVAFILIALFPCDPNCVSNEPTLRMTIHLLAGLIAMGFEVLAPLVFGIFVFQKKYQQPLRWTSLALGLVGVTSYLILIVQTETLQDPGLVQRIVQAIGDIWLLTVASHCLKRN